MLFALLKFVWQFQSTPPRRRRQSIPQRKRPKAYFNPRLREGGDRLWDSQAPIFYISIHASAKEATRHIIKIVCIFYFNPRLREGGDMGSNGVYAIMVISIHASAKEATFTIIFFMFSLKISIHASAKEATLVPTFSAILVTNFNPRLREGGDPFVGQPSTNFLHFNPRLREGGDLYHRLRYFRCIREFQSTPPRRRRPVAQAEADRDSENFNPRLREGGDTLYTIMTIMSRISIHASAKEATWEHRQRKI